MSYDGSELTPIITLIFTNYHPELTPFITNNHPDLYINALIMPVT